LMLRLGSRARARLSRALDCFMAAVCMLFGVRARAQTRGDKRRR
jgi:hypothetical protein